MRIAAYTALHYGREYLAYAIRSVIDVIDDYYVLYTATGSHGHQAPIACPETRAELYAIASDAAGAKLRWIDGTWAHEGLQRDSIFQHAADADVILVLDADEVWQTGLAAQATRYAYDTGFGVRVPFIHYWRSFSRAFVHDPALPPRVLNPRHPHDAGYLDTALRINHFGYAQRAEIVAYKMLTHGHRNEWRRDCNWMIDVFLANRQNDCHPVGSQYWNAETVNPYDFMPNWMQSHPYYSMGVIE